MGRQQGKGTVGEHPSIDVRAMRRRGLLVPGRRETLSWSRGSQQAGAALCRAEPGDRLRLRYRIGASLMDYHVAIAWTPCHLGGRRPWFLCPACGHRAAILHLVGDMFACRQCQRLNYASQQSSKADAALSRSLQLRRALGCNEGPLATGADWIPKPKGMHARTFAEKVERIREADSRALGANPVYAPN